MHVHTILKVYADSEKEAISNADGLVEDSIENDNSVGWDYCGDSSLITKDMLKGMGYKSFKDLEKGLSENRKNLVKSLYESAKVEVTNNLIDFAPLEELPLYINDTNKEIRAKVERRLKNCEHSKKIPDNFRDLRDFLFGHLKSFSKRGDVSMARYYLRKAQKLNECIENPYEPYITLQCIDNELVDMTESTDGKHTFYVETDRHC